MMGKVGEGWLWGTQLSDTVKTCPGDKVPARLLFLWRLGPGASCLYSFSLFFFLFDFLPEKVVPKFSESWWASANLLVTRRGLKVIRHPQTLQPPSF